MQWAEQNQGQCLLRIEDIDHTRCKEQYIRAILEDLTWLGLRWSEPVLKQSQRMPVYLAALDRLRQMHVIYPCFCTRRDIEDEIKRMASAPHRDDPPPDYPGTCRRLSATEQKEKMLQQPYAWRLDVAQALSMQSAPLTWQDGRGCIHPAVVDYDVVIGRRDIGISYHLAVVVDDAEQGITHIIRGEDLRDSISVHRLLQSLLGLPEPAYIHHRLVRDSAGNRIAKRHAGTTLRSLRAMNVSPDILRDFLLNSADLIWPEAGI
jgi:glutamyl-Q tRNA(Asp) synthetase